MSAPRSGEQALAVHDRQLHALALRKRGASYDAIAAALGYAGKSGAFKAVLRALHETLVEPTAEVRALELERLDHMPAAVWTAALTGDIPAQQQVLRLMDRRARYLGLDAPSKIDIEQRVRIMAEQRGLDGDEAVAEAQFILKESLRGASR